MMQLNPKGSPVKNGLGIGEKLCLQFATSLADGSTVQDLMGAYAQDGEASYNIGFHAISASSVKGQSLSGMNMNVAVPEPAALVLVAATSCWSTDDAMPVIWANGAGRAGAGVQVLREAGGPAHHVSKIPTCKLNLKPS